MTYLLDTHAFLWLQTDPKRVGEALDVLADEAQRVVLSSASSWEIAIKHGLGRLPLPEPPAVYVPARARVAGVELVAVDHSDVLAVATLPPLHTDPFDRLLVVQAHRHGWTLVTADRQLDAYDVEILAL